MPAIMHVTKPLSEAERNARLYGGDILIFRGFPRVVECLDLLRARCLDYLGDDPLQVHTHQSATAIEQRLDELRAALRRDDEINHAWREALAELGVDSDATYGDGVVVRGQPPGTQQTGSRLAPLATHRDTWGSNIAAQTNWWMPLYTTTPERTLALYPAYFERPVTNNSTGWDFKAMGRARKAGDEYPLLPTATEPPPQSEALAISLSPGDLLCFSGAHLHASVPNTTEATRLSFETRTVNGTDAMAGHGAPNVDGGAVYTTYSMFKHLESGQKLDESRPT